MHQIAEVTKSDVRTKCGIMVKKGEATVWWRDVSCELCLPKNLKDTWQEASVGDTMTTQREKSQDTQTQESESAIMAKTLTLDTDFISQVQTLRDAETKKWDEISEITGVAVGKCMLAYAAATVPKKEIIKNATADDVVQLRNERNLSWGQISVRTQLPESTCRTLYTEATGSTTKGLRIGKGGRHPGAADGSEPKAEKAPRAAKAPKAEKPADPAHDLFAEMDEPAIIEALSGYAIKVDNGDGSSETLKVKAVKRAAKGKAVLTTAEGEARTVKLSAISTISKKKVA